MRAAAGVVRAGARASWVPYLAWPLQELCAVQSPRARIHGHGAVLGARRALSVGAGGRHPSNASAFDLYALSRMPHEYTISPYADSNELGFGRGTQVGCGRPCGASPHHHHLLLLLPPPCV